MGTSFSTPRDENLTLPEELVINILSYLSLHDLVSCRLVARDLNDIINGSQHFQHQIFIAAAESWIIASQLCRFLHADVPWLIDRWHKIHVNRGLEHPSRSLRPKTANMTETKHCCISTMYDRRKSTRLSRSPSAIIMTSLLWDR